MKKLFVVCIVVWTWLSATIAWARLGETRAECIARYGQPEDTADPQVLFFHKNTIRIRVELDTSGHVTELLFDGPPLEHGWVAEDLVRRNLGRVGYETVKHRGHEYWWHPADHRSYAHWIDQQLVIRATDPPAPKTPSALNSEEWKRVQEEQKKVRDKLTGF